MEELLYKFVKKHGFSINKLDFLEFKKSHPDNPSIFSISDTLSNFSVDNVVAEVEIEEFENLPQCFFSFLNITGSLEPIIVEKFNSDTIFLVNVENKNIKLSKEKFLRFWSGLIIVIDLKANNNKEKISLSFSKTTILNGFAFFAILFLGFILGIYLHQDRDIFINNIFISLMLFSSVLIILEEFGQTNVITDNICGEFSDRSNCHSVINSKSAFLFKSIKLTDLSFPYIITLLVLNLAGFSTVISISCLIFIFTIGYSLYLQTLVLKTFCPICLTLISFMAIFTLWNYQNFDFQFSWYNYLTILLVFLMIASFWFRFKPYIQRYIAFQKEVGDLKKIKFDKEVFQFLISNNNIILPNKELKPLMFGDNKNSSYSLSFFISPNCIHCSQLIKEYILNENENPDLFNLEIYFNYNPNNSSSEHKDIPLIIYSLVKSGMSSTEAINDWFVKKLTYDQFTAKYGNEYDEETKYTLTKQFEWCNSHELNYAPIKFFNSRLIPKAYTIKDVFQIAKYLKN